ncbi:maleylacetoacetate isomerase [Croceicoccus naphthovorans]|uniref:Maleylacetoacetate isomerase n=1 Tax=Croceicoccus naphthovorans TaxID=1348774 RepID=A0A0G3XD39_9SPHN|nr:maleylacetoacetate isomerase [Croceicoccus naphthovorans]AKM09495.1 maleylacetoacetate isomerase [Croceicoccus naphthovorans]MBB3989772.1 maleylpyruvate isomerase [Croceicoccus naphthovorans]
MSLVLHGYWRSGTSYRTRIALNLKGLAYTQSTHDLRKGEQKDDSFTALQPQGLVPALEVRPGFVIPQSVAILEWLEETCPAPALLPGNADERALVRAMCAMIGSDVHPLNNLRILKYLKGEFGQDQAAIDHWAQHWIAEGFAALDRMIERYGADYAYGTTPTLVDCYLVPQVYSAERFGSDLSEYPALMAAYERASSHPAIVAAHPDKQPDAD